MRRALRLVFILTLIMTVGILPACNGGETTTNPGGNASTTPQSGSDASYLTQLDPPEAGEQIAVITTSKGVIKLRLFPEIAPKAVENFVGLANKGYYNGLIFHRTIANFMIQGGDPKGDGTGGESFWGGTFGYEFDAKLSHFYGALAMAHSSAPDSNGSQFYVVQAGPVNKSYFTNAAAEGYMFSAMPQSVKDKYLEIGGTPHLDGLYTPQGTEGHTVFGQVFEGMTVVDAIANVETGPGNKPLEDIVMEKVEIVTYEG